MPNDSLTVPVSLEDALDYVLMSLKLGMVADATQTLEQILALVRTNERFAEWRT